VARDWQRVNANAGRPQRVRDDCAPASAQSLGRSLAMAPHRLWSGARLMRRSGLGQSTACEAFQESASLSRREFTSAMGPALALVIPCLGIMCATAKTRAPHEGHPEPRPGIDASRVLTREELRAHPKAIPSFEMVRKIPAVTDGIRCHCGCAGESAHYSLLSCFEGKGMARDCELCQEQATRVFELHRSGNSLEQIRTLVDAAFG